MKSAWMRRGQIVHGVEALRNDHVLQDEKPEEHQRRQIDERPRQQPRRSSGGRHHDQLAVAVEPVEAVDHAAEQRDRRDRGDEKGQAEAGDGEEDQDRLALGGQQADLLQGAGDPDDRRQRRQAARNAMPAMRNRYRSSRNM